MIVKWYIRFFSSFDKICNLVFFHFACAVYSRWNNFFYISIFAKRAMTMTWITNGYTICSCSTTIFSTLHFSSALPSCARHLPRDCILQCRLFCLILINNVQEDNDDCLVYIFFRIVFISLFFKYFLYHYFHFHVNICFFIDDFSILKKPPFEHGICNNEFIQLFFKLI